MTSLPFKPAIKLSFSQQFYHLFLEIVTTLRELFSASLRWAHLPLDPQPFVIYVTSLLYMFTVSLLVCPFTVVCKSLQNLKFTLDR